MAKSEAILGELWAGFGGFWGFFGLLGLLGRLGLLGLIGLLGLFPPKQLLAVGVLTLCL